VFAASFVSVDANIGVECCTSSSSNDTNVELAAGVVVAVVVVDVDDEYSTVRVGVHRQQQRPCIV
jgi:hypothetical protein